MSEHEVILILGIIMVLLLIAYGVYLWYSYNTRTGFFAYSVPPLKNGFQPAGKVVKLTPAEQQERRNTLTTGNTQPNAVAPPVITSDENFDLLEL